MVYKILALDVATKTGYAYFHNNELITHGVIELKSKDDHRKRFKDLRKEVKSIIGDLKPNIVILEGVYRDLNVQTTALLNQYRGVVIEALPLAIKYHSVKTTQARAEVIPKNYKPKYKLQNLIDVKNNNLNKGLKKKEKKIMAFNWVIEQYNLKDFSFEKDNDITDAIILANWFLNSYNKKHGK